MGLVALGLGLPHGRTTARTTRSTAATSSCAWTATSRRFSPWARRCGDSRGATATRATSTRTTPMRTRPSPTGSPPCSRTSGWPPTGPRMSRWAARTGATSLSTSCPAYSRRRRSCGTEGGVVDAQATYAGLQGQKVTAGITAEAETTLDNGFGSIDRRQTLFGAFAEDEWHPAAPTLPDGRGALRRLRHLRLVAHRARDGGLAVAGPHGQAARKLRDGLQRPELPRALRRRRRATWATPT